MDSLGGEEQLGYSAIVFFGCENQGHKALTQTDICHVFQMFCFEGSFETSREEISQGRIEILR